MQLDSTSRLKHLLLSLSFVILCTAGIANAATKHIITFKSYEFDTDTLTLNVGDTIEWQGSFLNHLVESKSIPSNAASFKSTNDTKVLDYVVTVAGVYQYDCLYHANLGMKGSFHTVEAGVIASAPIAAFQLYPNTPNPVTSSTEISFFLEKAGNVMLKVYDEKGVEISTLMNSRMERGGHNASFNAAGLPNGVYFYELQANGTVAVKQMVVQH